MCTEGFWEKDPAGMAHRGSSWPQEAWTTGLALIFQEAEPRGVAVGHRQGPRVMMKAQPKVLMPLYCQQTASPDHMCPGSENTVIASVALPGTPAWDFP